MFSLALSLTLFWKGREERAPEFSLLDRKARWLGTVSFLYMDRFLQASGTKKKVWCEEQESVGDPLLGVLQGKGTLLVCCIQQEDRAQHLFAHSHCHLNLRFLKSSGPLVLPADDFAKG